MKYVISGAALLNLLYQGWNPQVALLPSLVAVELSYMKYAISGAALISLLNQGWNPQVASSICTVETVELSYSHLRSSTP